MAMRQEGYVTEVTESAVKVSVIRESACGGNCAHCNGCPAGTVIITCTPDLAHPVKVGDRVILEMPTGGFFKNVFFSYGVMSILFLTGAILGYIITKRESMSILGAAAGLLLGIAVMTSFNRIYKSKISIKYEQETESNI